MVLERIQKVTKGIESGAKTWGRFICLFKDMGTFHLSF